MTIDNLQEQEAADARVDSAIVAIHETTNKRRLICGASAGVNRTIQEEPVITGLI
jgi:hypothetical protein